MGIFVTFLAGLLFSAHGFAETVDGQWHVGIGDPTVFGWVTVVFYVVAALLSFKGHQQLQYAKVDEKFWLYLAAMLLLLGVNKQLDLQSLLTELMRSLAIANGWYEKRRVFQAAFIILLGVSMLAALVSLRTLLAKSWHRYKLAWFGIVLLCTFVLMRAASFHHFDGFINANFFGLRMNVILEVGSLIIIMIAALKSYPIKDAAVEGGRFQVDNYVKVPFEGAAIQCPKCAFTPISKAVDGRLFKCKQCRHQYTVIIT